MIIIPSLLLASAALAAPAPPASVPDVRVQFQCADGKLVKIAVDSPMVGWINFEIPPDICAPTEPKNVPPPRRAKRSA